MDENRFRCDYALNGECQLYSKPCEVTVGCAFINSCAGCTYKSLSMDQEPCYRCDALFKTKRR